MGSLQTFSASSQLSLSQAALFPQNKNPSRLGVASNAAAMRETLPSSCLSSPTPVYSNSSQLSLTQTKLFSPKKKP
ncbi:uncharacterized protein DS421_4g121340 [Arachis hypogaea]|nr:uncharacterized protein DS421_4g121340 [Arachis hypogaea]